MPINTPTINGVRYDASSVDIRIFNTPYVGIKALNFETSLEPVDVYGTRSGPIGRTRGKLSCTGSMEMYLAEANDLITVLRQRALTIVPVRAPGAGWMEIEFDINVSYYDFGSGLPISYVLRSTRVKKAGHDLSTGSGEPMTRKFDLSIMQVVDITTSGPTAGASDALYFP